MNTDLIPIPSSRTKTKTILSYLYNCSISSIAFLLCFLVATVIALIISFCFFQCYDVYNIIFSHSDIISSSIIWFGFRNFRRIISCLYKLFT